MPMHHCRRSEFEKQPPLIESEDPVVVVTGRSRVQVAAADLPISDQLAVALQPARAIMEVQVNAIADKAVGVEAAAVPHSPTRSTVCSS